MLRTLTCIVFVLLVGSFSASAQEIKYSLSGYALDSLTNTPLPGTSVFVRELSTGTVADENGYYNLLVLPGLYHVIFSFVGYRTDSVTVRIQSDVSHAVKLSRSTLLSELVVTAQKSDEKLTQTETGLVVIQKSDLEKMPYLLGEIDPVRMIQLMPGIHTAGEGSTGFYVRGGAVDQNLMVLDNSTIYNPSHLFGFFSIFNGAAVQDMELYKSGIPAMYGGRLSSVMNIHTRKGSTEKLQGEGSIGVIASSILVEGPIKKNKGSFLVSARRTYVDLLTEPLRKLSILKQDIKCFFYDINANLDYKLGTRDNVRFRGYLGKDKFTYVNNAFKNAMDWRNISGSITWDHAFHENLISSFTFGTSLYDMDFDAAINTYAFNITSDISDKVISYQLNWQRGFHDLTGGLTYTYHKVRPNNINASSDDVALEIAPKAKLYSHEAAMFINDKIKLSDALEVSIGVRFTGYGQAGPFTRYIQDENFQILDTVKYSRGSRIADYLNVEPRLAVRYSLNDRTSLKFSYDKTYQYMHMAPLSSVSLPLDIWVPSSEKIKPQYAYQWSGGYFRNFKGHSIEASAVAYYKTMYHQIEYREGVIIGYSKGFNFDDNFVFGKGKSYGLEFSVKKNTGNFTGQISYTLSKTTRTFSDLNEGKPFTAKYDRLHDLSLMANYVHNSRWTFSSVLVYGTGNALNLPVARYIIQGNVVNEYGERNAFRMPAYHRVDLAATFAAHRSERFESYWVFSLYNVYSRKNPYYVYFETKGNLDEHELETKIEKVSLFPILPAITYRIKF